MSNDLVAYSRAGDVFHYRWAARRSLKLIYPNSCLTGIYIEGSFETEKAGEYVIDVSEYSTGDTGKKKIDYYQLKHTTVQVSEPFTISDLKDTFIGFAARYLQHKNENNPDVSISFTVITNRKVADSFRANLLTIINKEKVDSVFKKTIESYTNLSGDDLVSFCRMLHLEDGEGNYNIQKDELRIELAQLIAGSIENAQIENLVALVQEKVLPDTDGRINREDVLKRFGITSEKELYPAPSKWNELINIIERRQHAVLKDRIASLSHPVIVHAAGGVGKSVFCRQLINSLAEGSLGIAYDCFGAGSYRNPSELRHKHRHALVQIANELASKGLCDPLIVQNTTLDEDIMRKFLQRIEASVKSLKKVTKEAQLFILVDAADNAEMAVIEYTQSCFAHELLRETMPDGCKLVLLCRTERIHLLQPQSFISQIELEPFSEEETLANLKKWFPDANEKDGIEFHRLTFGNPRVQANALDVKHDSIHKLLASLGPSGTSVEKQIELQLNTAISKMRDLIPQEHHHQINSICLGLASLPPHIPIDVLSKVANVSVDHVKSFVSDIGRSLWLYDTSIQFSDEPTETWFRSTFLATKKNYEEYIAALEPLSHQLPYVAEVLPQLYLQAGQYNKLIAIALSDDFLPENNPIDARNIRVYRLQFAFKAALKLKNFKDAIKLAMRAGEEVAGNQRQLGLFQNNIDLLVILQDKQKVQEIAFKRILSGAWGGSENVYTASLLSGINEYKGEARGYLRAALNWLQIYYEELRKSDDHYAQNEVTQKDILEIAYTFFNIYGAEDCIDFLNRFKSKLFVFGIMQNLIKRFIDIGNFETINIFLEQCRKQPYYIVAITGELLKVGHIPEVSQLEPCLELLLKAKYRIKRPQYIDYNDNVTPAIIAFIEACLYRELSSLKLLKVLKYYVPEKASQMVKSAHQSYERTVYLKALAIRCLLNAKSEVDIDAILPQNLTNKRGKNNYDRDNEIKEFKEIITGLFPWFFLRAKILGQRDFIFEDEVKIANEKSNNARTNRYRSYDTLPNEIAAIQSSILILYSKGNSEEVNCFFNIYIQNNKALWITDELNTVRAAFRLLHLSFLKQRLEQTAYERIKSIIKDGPEETAERYIGLARAVLNTASDDASVYFEEAVNIVSKFGDEIVRRWEAVVSLAKQACNGNSVSDELAYRFIRCAEVVGEYVSREKYWNRSEAIAVCARMSSGAGIAALSRWRDRDIGRFEYQLEELLVELVESGKILPATGWAMSRLFGNHQLKELLSICLENETDTEIKQSIFADAIQLLRIEGCSVEYWKDMKQIADKRNIQNDTLERILLYNQNNKQISSEENTDDITCKSNQDDNNANWEVVFGSLDILSEEQFEKCFQAFNSMTDKPIYRNMDCFWSEIIHRLSEKNLWKFIDVLLASELSRYELKSFFSLLPEAWKNKISYKKKWPDIVKQIGCKYAQELISIYSFKYFMDEFNLNSSEVEKLKEGIFEGLANGYEFSDAKIFFGFVSIAISKIDSYKATEVLDFSLSRFELHIDNDFADGKWDKWLCTSKNINNQIAGFIWSELGSPRSVERWNAAHTVRALAEFNCKDIIDELINWMQHDKVDAFGSSKFPFYNLHARLYLLIALARISQDKPELLIQHKNLFVQYALGKPHILIQKYSAEIGINILKLSDTDNDLLGKLKLVGRSKFHIKSMKYNESIDSYWHLKNLVEINYKYLFAYDFGRYWFEPLGKVFGISSRQTQDIAATTIIRKWKTEKVNGYNNDPRYLIWNRYSGNRETWHDHGDCPESDNLDFYMSYHSLMVTASELLNTMPAVSRIEWPSDEWNDWLSDHLLSDPNGKWIYDYRDPVPIIRPKSLYEEKNENWKFEISDEDYLAALFTEDQNIKWINVKGGWTECVKDRQITVSISSALVSNSTSNALMNALQTCPDPHDFKLPDYGEENMEFLIPPFNMNGWIISDPNKQKSHENDPYADQIEYPPYIIGDNVSNKLSLTVDSMGKNWFISDSKNPLFVCEMWSSYRIDKDKNPDQSGMRMKATLPALQKICVSCKCDVIIKVMLKREINYNYRTDKYEYTKDKHKIFLITSNGKIRSTDKNY